MFFALIASIIQLGSGLGLDLTWDQQGALNATVVFVAGCIVAWRVAAEKGIALLGGVAKSLAALALAFGAHLSPELQSSLMLVVTMGTAFYLRTQVVAPAVSGPLDRVGG